MNILIAEARAAAEKAYCPYSDFRVGAAVGCTDGTYVTGCNVENASYGLTICAERVAIFKAISEGKKPYSMGIVCLDADEFCPKPSRYPCGACRQVMSEFLHEDAVILIEMAGDDNVYDTRLHRLLPLPFKLQQDNINSAL